MPAGVDVPGGQTASAIVGALTMKVAVYEFPKWDDDFHDDINYGNSFPEGWYWLDVIASDSEASDNAEAPN